MQQSHVLHVPIKIQEQLGRITREPAFELIATWMQEHQLRCTTLYLSNIAEWLRVPGISSILPILGPATWVISSKRTAVQDRLAQNMETGQEYRKKHLPHDSVLLKEEQSVDCGKKSP